MSTQRSTLIASAIKGIGYFKEEAMKSRNRLFAILLALAMIVTYMPGLAYAETIPDSGQTTDGQELGDGQDGEETGDEDNDGLANEDNENEESGDETGDPDGNDGDDPNDPDTGGDPDEPGIGEDPDDPYEDDPYNSGFPGRFAYGDTSMYASEGDTEKVFMLTFAVPYSEEVANGLRSYYSLELRENSENAFILGDLAVDEEASDNEEIFINVPVTSRSGLEEGGYQCSLYALYDETGQSYFSEETELGVIHLEVLNYDPDDYRIAVEYCSEFVVSDPEADQDAVNAEYADCKDITITNAGKGNINVSGDSYVVDKDYSDEEAFVINFKDEEKELEPEDSWSGMTVLPKAGMPAGVYKLHVEVSDETGYATDDVWIESRVGDPLIIESSNEELSFYYNPASGEPVDGPQYCDFYNRSSSDFTNVTVESSSNAFTAKIVGDDEEETTVWGSGSWLEIAVDVTNKNPARGTKGNITLTAMTEDERTTNLKIPVRLTLEGEESPSFNTYYTYEDCISKQSLHYVGEDGPSELMAGGFNYDVSLVPADNYYAVNLTGESADKFDLQLEYNEGQGVAHVTAKEDAEIAEGNYCLTMSLYYDPDGQVSTEGEPVDSFKYNFEVYDEDEYRLVVLDENGETVLDENNDPEVYYLVDFGTIETGFSEEDAEAFRKTITLKNAGSKSIALDPKYFYGGMIGDTEGYTKDVDYGFNDGDSGVKTLDPGDTYEFSLAPAAGAETGHHWDSVDVRSSDGKSNITITAEYTVIKNGLHVKMDAEQDDEGNYLLDLGIDSTNEEETPSPHRIIEINNYGSVPTTLSVNPAEGSNENLVCGFCDDDCDQADSLSDEWRLEPGEYVYAHVEADYEALNNTGVYNATFVINATALDDEGEPTDQSLNYNVLATYEISDESFEVAFDFREMGNYEHDPVTVTKGTTVSDALDIMYEDLGISHYGNLDVPGYRCVGISYEEDVDCTTWAEYYNKQNNDENYNEIVRSNMTIYFDWAELIDSVKVTIDGIKCGDKASESVEKVKVTGLGQHCSIKSIKATDDHGRYFGDDEVIKADDSGCMFEISLDPDYGYIVDKVDFDDWPVYVNSYDNNPYVTLGVNVSHRITQIAGRNATCESAGVKNHFKCKACGKLFSDRNGFEQVGLTDIAIPSRGHKWGTPEYTWSDDHTSCTASSVCERDSEHVWEETVPTTASSDTNNCSVDRTTTYTAVFENPDPDDPENEGYPFETQTDEITINAGEHTWNTEITKPATCTEAGNRHLTCSVCGSEQDEEIPATDHDWGEWEVTTTPTCCAGGVETRTCRNDSEHKETRDTEPDQNAHDWGEWEVTTPATCCAGGVKTRTCRNDSTHIEKQGTEPDQNAHDWGEWEITTPATCTEGGEKTRTCRNDSTHIEKQGTEPDQSAHVWGTTTYEWSADNSKMTAKRVCSNDASHVETETVYTTLEVTAATCTSKKKITYTATFENTAFETQSKTMEDGEVLGHDPVYHEAVAATCNEDGNNEYWNCSRCGKFFRDAECTAEIAEGSWEIPQLISIAKATVTGVANKVYTGKALTQKPVVKLNGKTLVSGTDFKLTYKNNKNVGTATVTITGKGVYGASINKTFRINPKGTTLSNPTAAKKGFTAKWKKQATQTTGYELQYALNKKFTSGKKSVLVTKNKTVSKKITKLKANKKYFVRIRTYKTVSGKKYYSAWSAVKTVKTKK